MILPLILAAAVFAQTDELQKRVRLEAARILIDDQVVYEGPWKKAEASVVDVGGKKARSLFGDFTPWKQIVLQVDGEERLRVPVRSIAEPIEWPPVRLEEVRPILKKLTESQGGRKTFLLWVSTEKADFEVYRGPEYETRVERTVGAFTVYLNGEPLYRVTRTSKPAPRVEDLVLSVNVHRVKAGLPLVRPLPALSRGCDLHALYLCKNDAKGLSGHDEDLKGVGYTEDGAKAGKRSVISPFAPHETPLEGVESLMATLYHRVALLQPSLGQVGVGWAHRKDGLGYLVIDVGSSDLKTDPAVYPIVYPVNGQEEVPLDFALGSRETPNPIPNDGGVGGYPVTVLIPEKRGKPGEIEAQLFTGETEVACWLSTPESPARKDWPQPGAVCLIPREKLLPGTVYSVRFRDKGSGLQKSWSFTTRK